MFMTQDRTFFHGASRSTPVQARLQRGFTLTELLIASAISLVAVAGMIVVMSSTLGSTTQVLNATRLSGDVRAALQVVSRDLRRANYSETFEACIGSGSATCLAVADSVVVNAGANCVTYSYERAGGTVSGAMRLANGALQFRVDAADCSNSANWDNITDPERVTISAFTLTDTDGQNLTYVSPASVGLSQRVRKVRVLITGAACPVGDTCADAPQRTVTGTVRVRNDILFPTPAT